jgi:hypothetical protein
MADLAVIINLIKCANNAGIVVSKEGNDLKVAFKKDIKIDAHLLQQLKQHKGDILVYLSGLTGNERSDNDTIIKVEGIEYAGRYYYEIGLTQLYWLNEGLDVEYKNTEETHGVVLQVFRISGDFDPAVFKKSVALIIGRHESLRATFHRINGRYMMRVEDDGLERYQMKFMDVRNGLPENAGTMNDLMKQRNVRFSLNEAPLFSSLILQTGTDEYIVSIKLHHILVDGWSVEILVRDLLIAYNDLRMGNPFRLGELPYQFKDMLAALNNYNRTNHLLHKQYWKQTFPGLPDELIFPGFIDQHDRELRQRIRQRIYVEFPDSLRQQLYALSRSYNTTLFVILQASFKAFIFYKTAKPDIAIGTYALGRYFPESYDQIGSYSSTELIRTFFHETDSFSGAIKKVIQSNDDLVNYRAFPLMEVIKEELDATRRHKAFWNFNIQFYGKSMPHANEDAEFKSLTEGLTIEMVPFTEQINSIMPIDMMLDFYNTKENLLIDAQYDSSLYEASYMRRLFDEYLTYTEDMAANPYGLIRPADAPVSQTLPVSV